MKARRRILVLAIMSTLVAPLPSRAEELSWVSWAASISGQAWPRFTVDGHLIAAEDTSDPDADLLTSHSPAGGLDYSVAIPFDVQDLTLDPMGNAYVVGTTGTTGSGDHLLLKVSPAGVVSTLVSSQEWRLDFGIEFARDSLYGLKSHREASTGQTELVPIDPETGAVGTALWVGECCNTATRLDARPSGLVVTNYFMPERISYYLVSYTGAISAYDTTPAPQSTVGWDIGADATVAVLSGGSGNYWQGTCFPIVIQAKKPDGSLWTETIGNEDSPPCASAKPPQVLPDGSVAVGYGVFGSEQHVTIFSPDGTSRFTHDFAPPADRHMQMGELQSDGSGRIFVSLHTQWWTPDHHMRTDVYLIAGESATRLPIPWPEATEEPENKFLANVMPGAFGPNLASLYRSDGYYYDHSAGLAGIPGVTRRWWQDPTQDAAPIEAFKYVALGDSFAAGEGVEPFFDPDNRCHRSQEAFSTRVEEPGTPASAIFTRSRNGDRTAIWGFQACAGATTEDMLETGQHADPLPQLAIDRRGDVLNPDDLPIDYATDLVTLMIGGNDVEFSNVLRFCWDQRNCATALYRDGKTLPAYLNQALATLAANLDRVYSRIKVQAPRARVLVLGYPHLFPATSIEQNCISLRQMYRPIPLPKLTGWSQAEQNFLRSRTEDLNSLIRARAEAWSFEFVSTTAFFGGHEVCGSQGEWINGPGLGVTGQGQIWDAEAWKASDKSFHPNACGQTAFAVLVNLRLNAHLDSVCE